MAVRFFSSVVACLSALVFLGACATPPSTPKADGDQTVILISIDGARYDYLDLYTAPHLSSIASRGVRAEYLKPVFPSKTFPNHYSLVTGLRPTHHGLVNNSMYDPEYDVVFSMGKREEVENSRWWGGEPIWITAEQQGVTAATFFFPGSETAIQETRPSYWYRYDGSISNRARVTQVLEWLDLPAAERPQLITLYFSDVDTAGHMFGPESPEVAETFAAIDAEIGFLLAGLEARGLSDKVNLVIASDHGMQAVDLHDHFVIDTAFDTSLAQEVVISREIVSVYPLPGQAETLYKQLKEAIPASFGQVLRKQDMPERFQYTDHRRIAEITLVANPGHIFVRDAWSQQQDEESLSATNGSHGYDNDHTNMFGMFIATGPAFKREAQVEGFEMVDLYQVLANILGLQAAPHDGNPAVIDILLDANAK
ncbi:alkaline phosphatase family protein [Aliidiomarina taiwanensis]|uniref:Alkaline phosphatase family protein n=1 Tax=Aliidiomarina taiwanensis TaxID=946228 RepID=A0A432XAQ2_9GAMM|nr:ectonucleotide pyrophosphatase/phosphodiesterase [Aliidiomarina taiwanensis]RUO44404.1 alkaline phosphatase family protein [Aliidiomarina taiwanensis]